MNEMPKPQYKEPFREPLADSDLHAVIKRFKSNPELIVKEIPMEIENYGPEYYTKKYARMRKMCKELCDKYGIATPDVRYVVGDASPSPEKSHSKYIYQVKDNVRGFPLSNIRINDFDDKEVAKFREDAERSIVAICQYLIDIPISSKEWMWDIYYDRQWVYGVRAGEIEKKMYLVDVDDFRDGPVDLSRPIIGLEDMIQMVEIKTGGKKLADARDALRRVEGKYGIGWLAGLGGSQVDGIRGDLK